MYHASETLKRKSSIIDKNNSYQLWKVGMRICTTGGYMGHSQFIWKWPLFTCKSNFQGDPAPQQLSNLQRLVASSVHRRRWHRTAPNSSARKASTRASGTWKSGTRSTAASTTTTSSSHSTANSPAEGQPQVGPGQPTRSRQVAQPSHRLSNSSISFSHGGSTKFLENLSSIYLSFTFLVGFIYDV